MVERPGKDFPEIIIAFLIWLTQHFRIRNYFQRPKDGFVNNILTRKIVRISCSRVLRHNNSQKTIGNFKAKVNLINLFSVRSPKEPFDSGMRRVKRLSLILWNLWLTRFDNRTFLVSEALYYSVIAKCVGSVKTVLRELNNCRKWDLHDWLSIFHFWI